MVLRRKQRDAAISNEDLTPVSFQNIDKIWTQCYNLDVEERMTRFRVPVWAAEAGSPVCNRPAGRLRNRTVV